MKSSWVVIAVPMLVWLGPVACGGNGGTATARDSGSTGDDDGDGGGPIDSGSSGDTASDGTGGYAGFLPDIGQITNQHGALLSSAKIVTVTFSSDTTAPMLQTFGDDIGASMYWKTATSEYGIGPATSGAANHVVVTTAAPNPWLDTDIETWMQDRIAGAPGNGWPVPDAQTMYMLYTPPNVSVTTSNGNGGASDACTSDYGYEGYHDELTVGSNANIVFGLIVGECYPEAPPPATALNGDTETAAHEMVEAATNPHTDSDEAWITFDQPHWAWEIFNEYQDEVGDACQNPDDSYYQEGADLPFYVQRIWSNESAAGGHDPCVPAPAAPYFNTTPLAMQTMTIVDGYAVPEGFSDTSPSVGAKGYHIPVGQTQTFQIGLYSDAPTNDWTLSAVEGDTVSQPMTSSLTMSLDKTSGNNGDIVNVTVKTSSAPSIGGTAVLMTIVSTQGSTQHYLPILIGTE